MEMKVKELKKVYEIREAIAEVGEVLDPQFDTTMPCNVPILVRADEPENKDHWSLLATSELPPFGLEIYMYKTELKEKFQPSYDCDMRRLEDHSYNRVTILNTTIVTDDGDYQCRTVSLDTAKKLLEGGFESAVGHQGTAEIISKLLGKTVPMNRTQYQQNVGDVALCFKLRGRPEEGKILSKEEIEEIGYDFKILFRSK